ncbi:MAG: hypothetical protein ACO25B_11630 [Chitinophagaceae bacterium]
MKKNGPLIIQMQKPADLFKSPAILFGGLQLLDKDVENYIVENSRPFPRNEEIEITLVFRERMNLNEKECMDHFHLHFSKCLDRTRLQLRQTLRLGWRSLVIAFIFLTAMYSIVNTFFPALPENGVIISIRELFIILGWVALWRPAELLLYEWFPLRRNVILYSRLSRCRIDFKYPGNS